MAIRDLRSNYRIRGNDLTTDGFSTIDTDATTVPQPLAIGTTMFMEVSLRDETTGGAPTGGVLDALEIRYTTISDVAHFYGIPANIAADSVLDEPELGNTIIDLETGVSPVLPHDFDTDGPLLLGVNINNPLGTYPYAFIYFDVSSANIPLLGSTFIGPVRQSSNGGIDDDS